MRLCSWSLFLLFKSLLSWLSVVANLSNSLSFLIQHVWGGRNSMPVLHILTHVYYTAINYWTLREGGCERAPILGPATNFWLTCVVNKVMMAMWASRLLKAIAWFNRQSAGKPDLRSDCQGEKKKKWNWSSVCHSCVYVLVCSKLVIGMSQLHICPCMFLVHARLCLL